MEPPKLGDESQIIGNGFFSNPTKTWKAMVCSENCPTSKSVSPPKLRRSKSMLEYPRPTPPKMVMSSPSCCRATALRKMVSTVRVASAVVAPSSGSFPETNSCSVFRYSSSKPKANPLGYQPIAALNPNESSKPNSSSSPLVRTRRSFS